MTPEHKKQLFYFREWLKAIVRIVNDENAPQWAIDLLKETKAKLVIKNGQSPAS